MSEDEVNFSNIDYLAAEFLVTQDNKLVICYNGNHNIELSLSEDEVETTKTVLADINFWSNFLGALSQALTTHR